MGEARRKPVRVGTEFETEGGKSLVMRAV
jgi:hypothetical protein